MEFLLVNHPLDCPICDQGGECDLQVSSPDNKSVGKLVQVLKNLQVSSPDNKTVGKLVQILIKSGECDLQVRH